MDTTARSTSLPESQNLMVNGGCRDLSDGNPVQIDVAGMSSD
jgi:hypothetical protein